MTPPGDREVDQERWAQDGGVEQADAVHGHHAVAGGQGEEDQYQTQASRSSFLTQQVIEHKDVREPRNAQGVGSHYQGRHGQQQELHYCGAKYEHSSDRVGPLPMTDSIRL